MGSLTREQGIVGAAVRPDRRQRNIPVYLDLRVRCGERRRGPRRGFDDAGRRRRPQGPPGVDVWA